MRILVLFALCLGVRATPARGADLQATFIGNMGVHVTDGSVALLSDFPYESGHSGYMRWSNEQVPKGPPALCLFTHSHADHFGRDRVAEYCAAVLGPQDTAPGGTVAVLAMAPEAKWQTLTVRPLGTRHGFLEHYSYLVEWGGRRIFFSGDTEDIDTLVAAKELDAAFVSPWLLAAVQKAGRRIDARQLIVYHHTAGESVPAVQGRIVPRQGQVFRLR